MDPLHVRCHQGDFPDGRGLVDRLFEADVEGCGGPGEADGGGVVIGGCGVTGEES